jgi:CRISPR-associated endonuclease/helicase Cas3
MERNTHNFFNLQSAKQIISECVGLSDVLPTHEKYLAHTPDEGLNEHTKLTTRYLESIVAVNRLNDIIDNLIFDILPKEEKVVLSRIKKILIESIVFHDLGKVNVNFQAVKMNNCRFSENNDSITTRHSLLGAYIFLVYNFSLISKDSFSQHEKNILAGFSFLFSYAISNHHKRTYSSIDFSANEFCRYIREFLKYIKEFRIEATEMLTERCFSDVRFKRAVGCICQNNVGQQGDRAFSLWCLLKLQYSLLTASDYYATNQYKLSKLMHVDKVWGVIDNGLSEKMIANIRRTKRFNEDLLSNYQHYLDLPFSAVQEKSFENLCILRQKLGAELIAGFNCNPEGRIFYLEAPTGGGKTNLSMLAIMKLLEQNGDSITKIFYVFPFTTLITQTFTVLKETFDLTDHEMIQIHSRAGFHRRNALGVDEDDEQRDYVDYLFVNYPVCLMSHIKFFDIIKSNNKETNYILHRLANSIVVIDELQSYSPSEWDKLRYFISHYAQSFNMRFIIMSATLPKIDGIDVGIDVPFEPLIKDVQRRYLQNPNFRDRVIFDYSLLDKYSLISSLELAEEVMLKSQKYAYVHGTVHTIIEFIYKRSTTAFFAAINELNERNKNERGFSFDQIWILSGTILEPRRREIINSLKTEDHLRRNILLITTQVVEAGVDIDMDLGFKNISLPDSDEQLAGRVNRNARKGGCKLFLFKKDEPFRVYKKDFRYKFSTSLYSKPEELNQVLANKNFHVIYDQVMTHINGDRSEFSDNFCAYQSYVLHLKYDEVDENFKLIDTDTISFFVPLDIDVDKYGHSFTKEECAFLESHGCLAGRKAVGSAIWKLYDVTIKDTQIDFIAKAVRLKTIGGIMAKFVFSIYNDKKLIEDIKPFLEYDEEKRAYEINGFYCFDADYRKVYDWEKGLNEDLFDSKFFIF